MQRVRFADCVADDPWHRMPAQASPPADPTADHTAFAVIWPQNRPIQRAALAGVGAVICPNAGAPNFIG